MMRRRTWTILLLALLLAPRTGVGAEECSNDQQTDTSCYGGGHGTGVRICRIDNNCPATGLCWGPCQISCDSGYQDTGGYCAPNSGGGGICCVPGTRNQGTCKAFDAQGNPIGMPSDDGLPDCGGAPNSSTSTSTSTAAAVAAETGNDAGQHMGSTASASGGSQRDSVNASLEVISLGANQTATSGAVFCAEAAVALGTDPALAAADANKCQESFASANAMRAMNTKLGSHGGFTPDDTVLGKDGTKAILADFEKRYGITGDDYVRRMLGPGGGPKELSNMLGSDADKFASALEEGKNGRASSGDSTLAGGGAVDFGKPRARNTGLRDSLKARLTEINTHDKNGPVSINLGRKVASDKITPLENVFSATDELTLFDIVHRKYREKYPMLVPYRVEK